MENIVVYNSGEIELKVSVENETVWLNRQQISELFDRDVKTIGKHINNVFKDGELFKDSVVANFATTATDGKTYDVEYYNLDVIISVGYRVKSHKGVRFRQWATSVLKQYIYNGYAINSEKTTHQRFKELESDVNSLKQKVNKIENLTNINELEIKQGIFYNGQIFDAHNFVSDLIRSAKSSIVLIDNYIDDTTLTLFHKNQDVDITIYTHTVSKALKQDIEKYNKQYKPLSIKTNKNFHDRFLILDEKEVYHIGASLKDLGKKVFGFSKMSDIDINNILK